MVKVKKGRGPVQDRAAIDPKGVLTYVWYDPLWTLQ